MRQKSGSSSTTRMRAGREGLTSALVSPFGASTGRNTLSTQRFIFGQSRWLRGMIRPEPGMALAYVD
ncbi:hypothetical protein SAMN04244559_02954 [Magnetospirillum fulvum]|uniref:Uncharacterized protein n=1 Tax=Magnetospirillum fulvum TaxID=1082 RepID=A0A1H6J684_MAGFU|nr:hypothetical protein SAMN04244559_02954 [Magnetospirillum fulvum]